MFDRIKTVRCDETGRLIEEWHGTKENPVRFRDIAEKYLAEYPYGVIEIRYVR
jgi:SPX domain protein involved in polyphosphate accumulation